LPDAIVLPLLVDPVIFILASSSSDNEKEIVCASHPVYAAPGIFSVPVHVPVTLAAAPACVTVNVFPATVIVPVRWPVPVLAATE
jgi:hypothetical protein